MSELKDIVTDLAVLKNEAIICTYTHFSAGTVYLIEHYCSQNY